MFNHVINTYVAPTLGGLWGYLLTTGFLQAADAVSPYVDLLGLGVGGAVAALVLWWKRQDDKKYSDSLEKFLEKSESREEQMITTLTSIQETIKDLTVIVDRVSSRSGIDSSLSSLEEKLNKLLEE